MSPEPEAMNVQRALDIAHAITAARSPRRAATQASSNDILDLAAAVEALDAIARAAADWICARESLVGVLLDHDVRAAERMDEEQGDLFEALAGLLADHQYITIE